MVADINPGVDNSGPSGLTLFQGKLYFEAYEPNTGSELWRSTGSGAELVGEVNPGPENAYPYELTEFQGILYFGAENDDLGYELWSTDGGPPKLVKDILPGTDGSEPYQFTAHGNSLFFTADDGVTGWEMWRVTDDSSVTVKVPAKTIRVDRAGRAKLRIRCPVSEISGPCAGKVVVKTKGKRKVLVGKGKFIAQPGTAGLVTLKLARKVRKLIRQGKVARKVVIRVTARDGAGNKRILTRGARLIGPGAR
jgi:ELWxxDGT repeat protein